MHEIDTLYVKLKYYSIVMFKRSNELIYKYSNYVLIEKVMQIQPDIASNINIIYSNMF